jgi:hypothetical protein
MTQTTPPKPPTATKETQRERFLRRAANNKRAEPSGMAVIIVGAKPPQSPRTKRRLSADEQRIVDIVERRKGHPLTEQEINLSLDQARSVGSI